MAVIHRTTMTPGKLELLAAWLPTRPWYRGAARPELTRAGGFRLDDPQGAVGIEFMVVADTSGDEPVAYHLPLAYRGVPLDDAARDALVGTGEHGVLGKRWVYDGAHDPVVVDRVLAFVQGRAEAQAQNVSDTLDPTVTGHFDGTGPSPDTVPGAVTDGPDGTAVALGSGLLTLKVTRVLRPADDTFDAGVHGHVTADWHLPDGTEHRGRFFVLRDN